MKNSAISPEYARRIARNSLINTSLSSLSHMLLPVWQLFYTLQLGMSLTEAMILSASTWAVTAIMNIPTGVWADKYGRMKLFRVGILLSILSYLPMFFTQEYWLLFVMSITSGIGLSMIDGTLSTNTMDVYEAAGVSKSESARFGSVRMAIVFCGRLISGIVGAWLYTMMPFGPLMVDMVLKAISLLQSYSIHEVRLEKPSQLPSRKLAVSAIKYALKNQTIRLLMIIYLLIAVSGESIWSAMQQYLLLRDVPEAEFGIIYAFIAAASAFSAWAFRRLHRKLEWQWSSVLIVVLLAVSAIFTRWPVTYAPYAVALVVGLGFGLIEPLSYDVIQRHVNSQLRSTIVSLRQLVLL